MNLLVLSTVDRPTHVTWRDADIIARRLKHVLRAQGFSQAGLGCEMGRARPTIERWTTGRSLPPSPALAELGTRFGLSIDWLLLGHGSMLHAEPESGQPYSTEALHVRLRHMREAFGPDMTTFARRTGTTASIVHNRERFARDIRALTVLDLMRRLGISADWLLLGRGRMMSLHIEVRDAPRA